MKISWSSFLFKNWTQVFSACIVRNFSSDHIVSLPDEYVNELQLYRESFKLGCMLDQGLYEIDLPGTGKTQQHYIADDGSKAGRFRWKG